MASIAARGCYLIVEPAFFDKLHIKHKLANRGDPQLCVDAPVMCFESIGAYLHLLLYVLDARAIEIVPENLLFRRREAFDPRDEVLEQTAKGEPFGLPYLPDVLEEAVDFDNVRLGGFADITMLYRFKRAR